MYTGVSRFTEIDTASAGTTRRVAVGTRGSRNTVLKRWVDGRFQLHTSAMFWFSPLHSADFQSIFVYVFVNVQVLQDRKLQEFILRTAASSAAKTKTDLYSSPKAEGYGSDEKCQIKLFSKQKHITSFRSEP